MRSNARAFQSIHLIHRISSQSQKSESKGEARGI
jgi:hypothetical protein